MGILNEPIIPHGIGLVILMAANILAGSLGAIFTKRFNLRRCLQGIAKGSIIIVCFAATYFAGYINPDIVAVNIGGIEANVVTALNLVVLGGYLFYAKQVIEKLTALINQKYNEKD